MSNLQVVMPRTGGPEVLRFQQGEATELRPGQVRVRMEAAGVAFAEVQMLRGRYYAQPAFPFVPGYDLVGRVVEAGSGATTPAIGQRVATMTRTGAWSEEVVLPAAHLVAVPEEVDPAEAVALVTNGVTAWQMLHRVARASAGQTVLVHGAAGGVGTLLVQLARQRGVEVIGTASPGKHEQVRALGATPFDYRDPDLVARVHRLAPSGVAAVFDHLAGPSLRRSWRMLGRGGTLVMYGNAATLDAKGWRLAPLASAGARLLWWSALPNGRRGRLYSISHKRHFTTDLATVLELLHTGALRPQIAVRLPLTEAAQALRMLHDRSVVGKVVLLPPAP